jgi:type VI secretion system protein ImpL
MRILRQLSSWAGVGIGLALIAFILVGFIAGWWTRLAWAMGVWFWGAILLFLVAGFVVLSLWLLPRYRKRSFLAQLHSEDARGVGSQAAESHRRLQEKLLAAIRTLESSPDLKQKAELPLYALPWYLLLGTSQAGKTTLLRGVASHFQSFIQPSLESDGPTSDCDWWLFNTAIVLDTTGRYATPTVAESDRAQWHRLLQLLRHYRELQPINGLIVAVGADTLATKHATALRDEATALRTRINEAMQDLGVAFPVYLMITRCDLIEGCTEFFECLPEPLRKQVFGYVQASPLQAGSPRPAVEHRFEAIGGSLVERLHQLRLAIFNAAKLPPPPLRQKIFCFPEEFATLQEPLGVFAETLFAENPYQRTPLFRGLFFGSAQQQGTPFSFLRRQFHFDSQSASAQRRTAYFLQDLFTVILPRDQYLARPTDRTLRKRLLKHLFGFGACLALCLLVVAFLTQTFLSDRRFHAAVDPTPCDMARGQQPGTPLLEDTERCRQLVITLGEQNRQRLWLGRIGFNRSGRLVEQLRQQYVGKFATEVREPLDERIKQHLLTGSKTIPVVFLLIHRIKLIDQCLSALGCATPIDTKAPSDAIATQAEYDYYRLMLDPTQRFPLAQAQKDTLQVAYETYLHWAPANSEILQQEREAHAGRLRSWFSAQQFAHEQVLLWANEKYKPVTLQSYWEGLPLTPGSKVGYIEGAYTPAAWEGDISPFLQYAGQAIPEMKPELTGFEETYRTQYFEQWRRFLADFPRGESLLREQRRYPAVKLLDEKSPYNRIVDVTFVHLKPFLPATWVLEHSLTSSAEGKPVQLPTSLWEKVQQTMSQWWKKGQTMVENTTPVISAESTLPSWVRLMHRYSKSDSRKAYLEALKQLREPLSGNAPMDKSFQLVQTAFQEGAPTEKSSQPVLKALWIIQQFRDKEGSGEEKEKAFWPLLERPVLSAWRMLLDGASGFLQKNWAENVAAPIRGLSEMEQVEILYGPQGRVREFVNQFMKPFLVDNESRLGQMFGEELSLPPTLLKVLRDEKQLKPLLEAGKHRVRVEALRETVIDSQTNLVEEKTEFALECEDRPAKIVNRGKEGGDAAAIVSWSPRGCSDVVITIFMSCDRFCVERATLVGMSVEVTSLRLTKRYPGQSGFLGFIKDFRHGAHEFGRQDFSSSQPPGERLQIDETLKRYGLNKIKVFYRVDVPPSLEKLMSLLPTSMVTSPLPKQ